MGVLVLWFDTNWNRKIMLDSLRQRKRKGVAKILGLSLQLRKNPVCKHPKKVVDRHWMQHLTTQELIHCKKVFTTYKLKSGGGTPQTIFSVDVSIGSFCGNVQTLIEKSQIRQISRNDPRL